MATIQLSQGFIRNQWLRGIAGFATGFRRVASHHKRLVDTFVYVVARGDKFALQTLSSAATMTFGGDDPLDVDLLAELNGGSAKELIGAGSTVAASITTPQRRGIMFADVARRANEIRRIRYFPG
jgi:hypothetical protein